MKRTGLAQTSPFAVRDQGYSKTLEKNATVGRCFETLAIFFSQKEPILQFFLTFKNTSLF
jgi:hypothetical protein